MSPSRLLAALALLAALVLGVTACGDSGGDTTGGGGGGASLSGDIAGAGSSAQQAAQEAFIANFENANSGVTVAYDPIGSGGGRDQFIAGGTDFAGSDAVFDEAELPKASKRCGPGDLIQIPDYISPIAVIYNLSGVDDLQLSPDTLAGIFKQDITKWNDPVIAKDNPGVDLPDTSITPVNRSDDSGTTENFTDYLHQAAPSVWTFDASETFPVKGGEAAAQTSGVVQAVTAGDGAIGYADASQAGDLGVAKVKVGNEYVGPSTEGAAKDLELSKLDPKLSQGKYVLAYAVDRTSKDPSTYPILLVSYLIGCTQYDSPNTAAIVKSYFNYIVSSDGQKAAAEAAGSAPLSAGLMKKVQPAVDAIQTG